MATAADDSRFGQGYGHDGAAAIKIHPFFRVIDWHALAHGKVCNSDFACWCVRRFSCVQVPSPLSLEDLRSDAAGSPMSKAKAKQAIQSRAFDVPPVRHMLTTQCVGAGA